MTERTIKQTSSVAELLLRSYRIFVKNWKLFLAVNIFTLVSAFGSAFGNEKERDIDFSNLQASDLTWLTTGYSLSISLSALLTLAIVFFFVYIFLYLMYLILQVKTARGEHPTFNELFHAGKEYFLRFIGLSIVSLLIIICGLVLFVIPGLIAIVMLITAPYFMIEKNLGISQSIKSSFDLAKEHFFSILVAIMVLFLVALVSGIISVIPFIGPIAGAVVTIAFGMVLALRYSELVKS